jgi:hypothetical protein
VRTFGVGGRWEEGGVLWVWVYGGLGELVCGFDGVEWSNKGGWEGRCECSLRD